MLIRGHGKSNNRLFNTDGIESIRERWGPAMERHAVLSFKGNRPDETIDIGPEFSPDQVIIPAAPGFMALQLYGDLEGPATSETFMRYYIIAWGILPDRSFVNVYSEDGLVDGFYGILRPDGRVTDVDTTWDDEATWIEYINENHRPKTGDAA
jgi:hypothetical protein